MFEVNIDCNVAYFIGVLHSDGYIYVFNDKKRNRKQIRLGLGIGKKSLPMAIKFQHILKKNFDRSVNLRWYPNRRGYQLQTSINKIWHILRNWQKYDIPSEIRHSQKLFGAYLAGVIDGDGHIKLKNNIQDRVIPQCMIRIAAECELTYLKVLVENHLHCNVHYEYKKGSRAVDCCFYVSRKNLAFILEYICPHLALTFKRERLKKYIERKMSLSGFEPESAGPKPAVLSITP